MKNLKNLEMCLNQKLPIMRGNWVNGRKKYDKSFSDLIGAIKETAKKKKRHWDCVWEGLPLELKMSKETHFWLDLVRYSEIIKQNINLNIITLFLFYEDCEDKLNNYIKEIYALKINKLLQILNLTSSEADFIVKLNQKVKHLNAQKKITKKEIAGQEEFYINIKQKH